MFGISNSNFAGNMGMGLNPSLFVGSPYHHEFNAISGDLFFDNDYIYVDKNPFLLRKGLFGKSVDKDKYNDYYDGKNKSGYSSSFIRGPSYIRNDENYSWGVHTALRSVSSTENVPIEVAKFIKEGTGFSPQHNNRYVQGDFGMASLMWGELGGTIGKVLHEERDKGQLTGAVTLKFLLGFDAGFMDVNNIDYLVSPDETLTVNSLTGDYGYALDNGEDDGEDFNKPFKVRGFGGGMDIGLTYYRKKVHGAGDCNKSAEIRKKYNYRAGLSLIDFGMVSFSKDARTFNFNGQSGVFAGLDSTGYNTIYDMDTSISNQFYGDPDASVSGSKIKMFLPAAISLQFDYAIIPKIFANATLIQPLPLGKIAPVRPSQINFSVRYETRKFEVAVPLSIYQYQYPHLGVAVRYGVLVIGTDRVGSYTGLWDVTGYDLFFGLKWNICDPDARKNKKDPNCPAY
jgi:uncharacterized protein DUF5723